MDWRIFNLKERNNGKSTQGSSITSTKTGLLRGIVHMTPTKKKMSRASTPSTNASLRLVFSGRASPTYLVTSIMSSTQTRPSARPHGIDMAQHAIYRRAIDITEIISSNPVFNLHPARYWESTGPTQQDCGERGVSCTRLIIHS